MWIRRLYGGGAFAWAHLGARVAIVAFLASVVASLPAEARTHHHGHARRVYVDHSSPTDPSKDAALIIDGETGKVLYARNANVSRHPASLTKMMTLYLLFEKLQKGEMTLATPMAVSYHASLQHPTKLDLRPGDTIDVQTAIKAIVVRSANDVAVTIAEAIGGTESHFAELMTQKARQFGMRDTYYHNASGLPDPQQISTASDLAVLARHLAYDFPQYFPFFATESFVYRGRFYTTHNNLIGNYEGADGIKTGYTSASGFNLVSSVVRNGAHIIGVVMGGRTARKRDGEMIRLLDNTFAQVAQNPRLVAHAQLPWKTIPVASKPNNTLVAGLSPGAAVPARVSGVLGAGDSEDEDSAESQVENDGAGDASDDNLIAAAPPPSPSTKPALVASYQPQQKPIISLPKPPVNEVVKSSNVIGNLSRGMAKSVGDWAIQIGAFGDLVTARTQLANYAEKSMDVLGQAQRIIVPFKAVNGQTLYRARFGPFVEREAREICARLTERGQTCFAATVSQ